MVHGDLKPHHVLFKGAGEGEVLQLCDFGFARVKQSSASAAASSIGGGGGGRGTLRWMAPELLRNATAKTGYRTDVWAFGVVAWQVLAHEPLPYPQFADDQAFIAVAGLGAAPFPPLPEASCAGASLY